MANSCRTRWENFPNKYRAGSRCDNFARSLLSQMDGDPQFFFDRQLYEQHYKYNSQAKGMKSMNMKSIYLIKDGIGMGKTEC